jgi:hypothetical protein
MLKFNNLIVTPLTNPITRPALLAEWRSCTSWTLTWAGPLPSCCPARWTRCPGQRPKAPTDAIFILCLNKTLCSGLFDMILHLTPTATVTASRLCVGWELKEQSSRPAPGTKGSGQISGVVTLSAPEGATEEYEARWRGLVYTLKFLLFQVYTPCL